MSGRTARIARSWAAGRSRPVAISATRSSRWRMAGEGRWRGQNHRPIPPSRPPASPARRLHGPQVAGGAGTLAGPAPGTHALRRGKPPAAPSVRVLANVGAAFDSPPQQALVQALNTVCGRTVDPAFAAAVRQEP